MQKLKIKVCGMRDKENLQKLLALKPDYIGFIFYPPSVRFVGDDFNGEIPSIVDNAKKVGVFVNSSSEYIFEKIGKYNLDVVQLHGKESPEQCLEIKQNGVEVIKAFSVGTDFDFSSLEPYEQAVDYFLFDTKTPLHGGSGIKFDWSILDNFHSKKPFFLSGGIGVDDVEEIKKLSGLNIFALDLNSKFEVSPAMKDISQLESFLKAVRG